MSGNDRPRPKRLPLSADSSVPPGPSSAPAYLGRQQTPVASSSSEQQHGKGQSALDDTDSGSQHMVLRPRHRTPNRDPFTRTFKEPTSSVAQNSRVETGSRSSAEKDYGETFSDRGDATTTTRSMGWRPRHRYSTHNPFIQATEQQDHDPMTVSSGDALPYMVSSNLHAPKTDVHRGNSPGRNVGRGRRTVTFASTTLSDQLLRPIHSIDEGSSDHGVMGNTGPACSSTPLSSFSAASSAESDDEKEHTILTTSPSVHTTPYDPPTAMNLIRQGFIDILKGLVWVCIGFILLDMIFALFFNISFAIHGPISLRKEPLINIEKQIDIIKFHTEKAYDKSSPYYRGPTLLHHLERNKVSMEFCEVVRDSWHRAWVKELLDEHSVCYQPDFPFEMPEEDREMRSYSPEDDDGDIIDEWDAFHTLKRASDFANHSPACTERLLAYTLPRLTVSEMIQLDDVCRWYSRRFHAHVDKGVKAVHESYRGAYFAVVQIELEMDGYDGQRDEKKYMGEPITHKDQQPKLRRERPKLDLAGRDGYNLLTAYNFMEEYPLQDGDLVQWERSQDSGDKAHASKQSTKEQERASSTEVGETQSPKRYTRKNPKAIVRKTRMWHRHRLGRILQMQSEVRNATWSHSWLGSAFRQLDSDRGVLGSAMGAAIAFCEQHTTGATDSLWTSVCATNLELFLDKEYESHDGQEAYRMVEDMHNATLRITAPFEALDSQRCALSSLYALTEGISDTPPHSLAIAKSPSGRINLGYPTATAPEPLGGRLLRLTPSSISFINMTSKSYFKECGALSPWQNANKALHNDDYLRRGHIHTPAYGRYNPSSTNWAWEVLQTHGELRAVFFSWFPVPELWSKLWREYSPLGWPDIDHLVERMPDEWSWGPGNKGTCEWEPRCG